MSSDEQLKSQAELHSPEFRESGSVNDNARKLMLKNTAEGYGVVTVLLHWVSALVVIGLFVAGVWMVDLTYYSSWYKTAPHIHKSVGILLLLATFFRLLWRLLNPKPVAQSSHKPWEVSVAAIAHAVIYALLLTIMVAGILISIADGRGIWVFNWFEVPGFSAFFDNQADIAGDIHRYLAYCLIALVVLHALGALKHHFIDKDKTLIKMFTLLKGK